MGVICEPAYRNLHCNLNVLYDFHFLQNNFSIIWIAVFTFSHLLLFFIPFFCFNLIKSTSQIFFFSNISFLTVIFFHSNPRILSLLPFHSSLILYNIECLQKKIVEMKTRENYFILFNRYIN